MNGSHLGQRVDMSNMPRLPIYMDYQATTPMDARVLESMMPFFTEHFGNPHSTTHSFGWYAEEAVTRARGQVAQLIGAAPEEIIFTSGATESNNLAIKGMGRAYRQHRNTIITIATEHKCVLESAKAMERDGMNVIVLPVGSDGLVNLEDLKAAMTEDTLMVSVMAANNEIGVTQPITEIGALCREQRVFFHTDAAQAVGKMAIDVAAMNIDLMSLSGHKLYGPKGIGALYVRQGARLRPDPLMSGGGQENGLRSGTLSPALCVGFGEACAIAQDEWPSEASRLRGYFDKMVDSLTAQLDGVALNGHREQRLPGNINLSFADVKGDVLLASIRDIAISSGAACASAVTGPSYVLQAIGVPDRLAEASIRIGLGRQTTEAEVDYAIAHLVDAVTKQREER
jgi:cysteine desulfurase